MQMPLMHVQLTNAGVICKVMLLAFIQVVAGVEERPRIYIHRLPDCSFEHFPPKSLDNKLAPNPPVMPIHRRIVESMYITDDPSKASLFYVPAPFFVWDDSHTCLTNSTKPDPYYHFSEQRLFHGDSFVLLPPGISGVEGNLSRSISVWLRPSSRISGRVVVVATGGSVKDESGDSYNLGIVNGCPAILRCYGSDEHVASCGDKGVLDGRWHHLAATYDGLTSRLFMDGVLVSEKNIILNTSHSRVLLGGFWHSLGNSEVKVCRVKAGNFEGDAKDLRLFDGAVRSNGMNILHGGFNTPQSHCFQMIRSHLESSPWFQRKSGWDHFVLHGSSDYPLCFRANLQNEEEHYTLEQAWPNFGHMMMLHLGARAELCVAQTPAGKPPQEDCVRRFFRMVTIPPLLEGEDFDCLRLAQSVRQDRPVKVAYRGLAYNAMVERMSFRNLLEYPTLTALHRAGQIRLEFTNWSTESLERGVCKTHLAQMGLCPWSAHGLAPPKKKADRKVRMKARSLELWPQSEFCLVLPGDGGYELRLHSIINLGCIPVIVFTSGLTLPKIPFPASIPWHTFAIFWDLQHRRLRIGQHERGSSFILSWTAMQLLQQLFAISPQSILRKRLNMARFAPQLSWLQRSSCQGRTENTALDLVVSELMQRARMSADLGNLTRRHWGWKVPLDHIKKSAEEDLTGNGCPLGYPMCELGTFSEGGEYGGVGDACQSSVERVGYRCPIGCKEVGGIMRCAEKGHAVLKPCRTPSCYIPQELEPDMSLNGFPVPPRQPQLLLLSFSDRPKMRALSWPRLEAFSAAHPYRYRLELHEDGLLNPRYYHPAWNKLALIRRALIMHDYDAIVWFDDDVLIMEPSKDPIFEVMPQFFADPSRLLLVSHGHKITGRTPFSTAVLVAKRGKQTLELIKELFQIGSFAKERLIDGTWVRPSHGGLWDQDALAVHTQSMGSDSIMVRGHREFHSTVHIKSRESWWQPGDFAAHITGTKDLQTKLRRAKSFLHKNRNATSAREAQ